MSENEYTVLYSYEHDGGLHPIRLPNYPKNDLEAALLFLNEWENDMIWLATDRFGQHPYVRRALFRILGASDTQHSSRLVYHILTPSKSRIITWKIYLTSKDERIWKGVREDRLFYIVSWE